MAETEVAAQTAEFTEAEDAGGAPGEENLDVLLDINMPKKDGFEVLKEACSDIALYRVLKKTPIIMLSNYSNQQDIDYCMKNGAQDFLIKSEWTPEAIIKKVKEYLEEK